MKILVLPMLVVMVFVSGGEYQSVVRVFILGGQSNMGGSGGVVNNTWDGVVPPECEANPRILRLGKDMKWEEAKEPLHKLDGDSGGGYGVGPGMAFANSLLKRERAAIAIGLVPCAVYGSFIKSWSRDAPNYTQMLARSRAAVRQGGMLRGLLWFQGESDSYAQADEEAYQARLEEIAS